MTQIETVQHAVELDIITMLIRRKAMNLDGLVIFHELLSAEVAKETNAFVAKTRENVLEMLAHELAAETGMPALHWLDRTTVDVPDDLSDLGGDAS